MQEAVIFIAGFIAAFIGTMSGGGAGILTLAALLQLGFPINHAIATNKFGDLGFFLPALRNFSRAKQIKKRALPSIVLVNVAGATIGTLLIARLNPEILKLIVAIVLVIVTISMLLKGNHVKTERPAKKYWPFVYFGTSISSGVLGAGTGILSTLTLVYLRGFTALQAMAHSFFANAVGSSISVTILLFSGLINYRYGLLLLAGNIIGSHLGSRTAIKKGNEFVRILMLVLAVVVLVQLLFI